MKNEKPKTYLATNDQGKTVRVTVPEDPRPEEIMKDALRECLSPEAVAIIAEALQTAQRCNDENANRQVNGSTLK